MAAREQQRASPAANMPGSIPTSKSLGNNEEVTPIKQSASQEKDTATTQEANDDTHMSDDEEEDEEEDNSTDDDDGGVEEGEDEKEEEESDDDEEETKEAEESDEESDNDVGDEGTKIGTTLRQSPVRSHLPVKAHRSSAIKASRTSPLKVPRSSTPSRTQSPFKARRSSAKVSDETAEEPNRPKSRASDSRHQAQTPELKPKRSQKAPLQSSPSKPSQPFPSKTTQSSPSKAGDIAEFDWDAFEKRYDQALEEASHKETELLKEFDQLVQYFHVWAEASSSHDNERAMKRRVTRERRVNLSEEQLKVKKSHLTEVVTAFQSALALLNQPHMQI